MHMSQVSMMQSEEHGSRQIDICSEFICNLFPFQLRAMCLSSSICEVWAWCVGALPSPMELFKRQQKKKKWVYNGWKLPMVYLHMKVLIWCKWKCSCDGFQDTSLNFDSFLLKTDMNEESLADEASIVFFSLFQYSIECREWGGALQLFSLRLFHLFFSLISFSCIIQQGRKYTYYLLFSIK